MAADDRDVLRRLWERLQARDWDAVGDCLQPDATLAYPHTGERFAGREAIVAINREYPDGWTIEIEAVLATDEGVASRVLVTQDGERHRAATFFTLRDGRLADGTEYWVTEAPDDAPAWRARFAP